MSENKTKKLYPTPHIDADACDIAKTVLMPGDPLRSKFIAETYLENAVLFNNVRGIHGYTGTYKGERVSVMASGMGIPSIGIYSYELYNFFGIENIIRIGSAGAISKDVKLGEILIAMGASTNSAYGSQFSLPGTFSAIADFELLRKTVEMCEKNNRQYRVGNLLSADIFYDDDTSVYEKWMKMGILAIEMEAAGLYMNAARAGKKALAICTVSDNILTGEKMSIEEREQGLTEMIKTALEVAVEISAQKKS